LPLVTATVTLPHDAVTTIVRIGNTDLPPHRKWYKQRYACPRYQRLAAVEIASFLYPHMTALDAVGSDDVLSRAAHRRALGGHAFYQLRSAIALLRRAM
jgi:hypothetical protein